MIYDSQLEHSEVAELSGNGPTTPPATAEGQGDVLVGSDSDEELRAADYGVTQVNGGYGDDLVIGTDGDDVLDGSATSLCSN